MIPPATSEGEISSGFDGVKGADDRSHESEHRSQCDEQVDPGYALLQVAHLHRTVGNDGFLDHLEALFHAVQSLIEDACHRSAGVSAHFLCGLHASAAQCTVDVFEQFRVVAVAIFR